ncbi:hypothetical protein Bbelb_047300 [Branchiostoma belcheri]|nr:hypothetical protein Bbelb_047300 [Branchiostoma belcheri]
MAAVMGQVNLCRFQLRSKEEQPNTVGLKVDWLLSITALLPVFSIHPQISHTVYSLVRDWTLHLPHCMPPSSSQISDSLRPDNLCTIHRQTQISFPTPPIPYLYLYTV